VIDNTYCPNASSTPERFSPVNSSALLAFSKIKKIRKTPTKNQKEVNARPPLDNTTPIRSAATPSSKVLWTDAT
jgi:hypothetical protein